MTLTRDSSHARVASPGAKRLLRGADTIGGDINLLPAGLDIYSSYVDNFGGFNELLAARPRLGQNAVMFSYTIFGNPANCGDIENGALPVSGIPHFLDHIAVPIPGVGLPMLYYSSGIANEVIAAAGNRKFIRQSAHYGAGEHICFPTTCGFPRADGTQWDDKGPNGENYDRSIWLPDTFSSIIHTPPPEDYMSIAVAELQGVPHVFVEDKEGNVWFTVQPKHKHEWSGGEKGKQIAGLRLFAPKPK